MMPDIYVWKARRGPVLLAALPPALAVLATFPSADWKLLLPICMYCSLFMLMGEIGRDRGYQKKDQLFALWGGKPTTVMLRHGEGPFDETTLAKLHAWLSSVTGVPVPSRRKESVSPDDADEIYEAYVGHLRDETRDTKQYLLVFEENVSYGFRRNVWGLRPYGIALATIGTLGSAVNLPWLLNGPRGSMAIATTPVSLVLLQFWLFWVNPGWVRIPASAYTERLMEAALRMAKSEPVGSKKKPGTAVRQKKQTAGKMHPGPSERDEETT